MMLAASISIRLLLSWVTTRRILFGWGSISFMIVAQLFHAGMVGGTLAVLLIYFLVSFHSVSIRDNLRPLASLVVIAAALGMLHFSLRTGVGVEKLWILIRDFDIGTITSLQAYSARGRGAYLSDVQVTAWLDILWNLPLRVLFFFASPFIWMVSQFRDVLGFLDGLVFLYVVLRIALDIMKRNVLKLGVCTCRWRLSSRES